MKINIEMEAWELATVIKGLTMNAQPEEKKPTTQSMSGEDLDKYLNKIRGKRTLTEQTKPILSDKTREELRKALANAFKVPEKVTVLPQKTESKKSGDVSKDNLDAFGALLRKKLKIDEILGEPKQREDNPNPNYRPPMGGNPTCS